MFFGQGRDDFRLAVADAPLIRPRVVAALEHLLQYQERVTALECPLEARSGNGLPA
jgi:hypothetical protein